MFNGDGSVSRRFTGVELGDVFALVAVGVADLVGEDFAGFAEGHSALVGEAYLEGLVGSVEVLP